MTDDWMDDIGGMSSEDFDQQMSLGDLDMDISDVSDEFSTPTKAIRRPPMKRPRTIGPKAEDAWGTMSSDDSIEDSYESEQYEDGWDTTDDTTDDNIFDEMDERESFADEDTSYESTNWDEDSYAEPWGDDMSEESWETESASNSFDTNANTNWDTFGDSTNDMFTQEDTFEDGPLAQENDTPPKKLGKVGTAIVIAIVLVLIALGIKLIDGMKITKKEDTNQVQTSNTSESKTQEDLVKEQDTTKTESDAETVSAPNTEPTDEHTDSVPNDTSVEPAEKQEVQGATNTDATDSISLKIVPNSLEVDYTKEAQSAEGTVTGKERYLKDGQLLYNVIVTLSIDGEKKVVNYYCGYSVFDSLEIGDTVNITYQQVSKTVISVSGIAK